MSCSHRWARWFLALGFPFALGARARRDGVPHGRPGRAAGAGRSAGAKFSTFADAFIDAGDRTAFVAYLEIGSGGVDASNYTGVWSDASLQAGASAELHLIARQNDQAPDTPSGARFASLSDIVVDKSGRIAFTANLLTGSGGVTSSNRIGVWAQRTARLR